MAERDIEKKFVTHVEALGGKCIKIISPKYAGMPDRLVLFNSGVMAFVEVKAPEGRLSRQQVIAITLLESLGFRVFVLDRIDRCFVLAECIKFNEPFGEKLDP